MTLPRDNELPGSNKTAAGRRRCVCSVLAQGLQGIDLQRTSEKSGCEIDVLGRCRQAFSAVRIAGNKRAECTQGFEMIWQNQIHWNQACRWVAMAGFPRAFLAFKRQRKQLFGLSVDSRCSCTFQMRTPPPPRSAHEVADVGPWAVN